MTALPDQHFGLPAHAIEGLQGVFDRWPLVERVLIYGSRAKGTYRQGSDIDLCLQGASLDLGDLLAMETAIDDLLLPWRVDLALHHAIEDPDLLDHIERVGQLFYERPGNGGDSGQG